MLVGPQGKTATGSAELGELQAAVKQLAVRLQAAQRRAENKAAACADAQRTAAGAAAEASALRWVPPSMIQIRLVQ